MRKLLLLDADVIIDLHTLGLPGLPQAFINNLTFVLKMR